MNVLIYGLGKMGIRHAIGAIKADAVKTVEMIDKSQQALDSAQLQLQGFDAGKTLKFGTTVEAQAKYDVCILATTAEGRIPLIEKLLKYSPRFFLIEKPIGQSLDEVEKICDIFSRNKNTKARVNFNTRLQSYVKKLKHDLSSLHQFRGPKYINVTAGAIGVAGNGVHLIDECFYLLDADSAELTSAEIYDEIILSGRGSNFFDFGGCANIKYTRNEEFVGKLSIQIIPTSSFGINFEVVGTNGYINVDGIRGYYTKSLRTIDSQAPVYRYSVDYKYFDSELFEIEGLDTLTTNWLNGLNNGEDLLPDLNYGMQVHRVLFEWLSYLPKDKIKYSIT